MSNNTVKGQLMMKYKEYEGAINDLVALKMKEIEEKENVRILHVIESGSRAWGFASPDSDYDVRFIYVRNTESYLTLQNIRDTIDWELNDVLDINGWDIKKVLTHIHKSNVVMYEWANSPVVYYTTEEWKALFDRVGDLYFSRKASMYHYYGTAVSNYKKNFGEATLVKYKKYFYVIRPLLACKWIEERSCPPPVLFDTLVETVLEEEMRPVVRDLISKKMKMEEGDKAPRIQEIDLYIEKLIAYYKDLLDHMESDLNRDWKAIDKEFQDMILDGYRKEE